MRVLLNVMLRSRERGMARRARERDERAAPWNDPPTADGSDGRRSRSPERASTYEAEKVLSETRTDGPGGGAGARQGARLDRDCPEWKHSGRESPVQRTLDAVRPDHSQAEPGLGHSSERGEAGPDSEADKGQAARPSHSSETRSEGDGLRGGAVCRPGMRPSHSSETRSGGDGPRDETGGGPEAQPGDLSEHGKAGLDNGAAQR